MKYLEIVDKFGYNERGDAMKRFKDTVVTEIYEPVTVFSRRGRMHEMKERHNFGISICLSGQITYRMGEKEYISRKGNIAILPQGATYAIYGDAVGLFPLINFEASGLELQEILILSPENPEVLSRSFEEIKKAFAVGNRMLAFERFYGMLNYLLSSSQRKKKNPLFNVLEYIENHLGDASMNNSTLAAHFGVSEVYFRKLFLAEVGVTPKQYILNLRIQKAKQLLSETFYTVTTIAELCGFGSLYHFCRAFKGKVGCTPRTYAEENKVYKI